MSDVTLQEMVDDIRFAGLAINRSASDVVSLAHTKTL